MSETMEVRMRRYGIAMVAMVAASVAVAGCSDSGAPGLVGRWEGTGRVALVDGSAVSSPQVLVIERQDEELLWGTIEYEENGNTVVEDVVGTLTDDGDGIVLTEPTSLWIGEVDGDVIRAVISWTGDAHGAFEVELERVED